MMDAILVLNAGSSSLKFAVYPDLPYEPAPILRGKVAGIGMHATFSAKSGSGVALSPDQLLPLDPGTGHDTVIPALLDWIGTRLSVGSITAAGHRVVHGGRDHAGPAIVSDALLF